MERRGAAVACRWCGRKTGQSRERSGQASRRILATFHAQLLYGTVQQVLHAYVRCLDQLTDLQYDV